MEIRRHFQQTVERLELTYTTGQGRRQEFCLGVQKIRGLDGRGRRDPTTLTNSSDLQAPQVDRGPEPCRALLPLSAAAAHAIGKFHA